MRTWVYIVGIVVGIVVLTGVVAAIADGSDNTGDTVRPAAWADDVCGAVGAWEGQLEAIGDDLKLSNVGARRNDGASGDAVEGTIYVRTVVDRTVEATDITLQEGLRRAGSPDVPRGAQASLILLNWAQATEDRLRLAKQTLEGKPNTTSAAFASLGAAVGALERSAVDGRAAFRQVAALDPALAEALDGSRTCRRLMEDQP